VGRGGKAAVTVRVYRVRPKRRVGRNHRENRHAPGDRSGCPPGSPGAATPRGPRRPTPPEPAGWTGPKDWVIVAGRARHAARRR
jgi:hypothetical protein